MNHVRGAHGAMRRALRTPTNPYRRRDTRPSGRHPVDWILVGALLGLVVVAAVGWLK